MKWLLALSVLCAPIGAYAASYPDMVGDWTGTIRTVTSGSSVSEQVAPGGAVIAEVELTLSITHQDGEVFIGESRSSQPGSTGTPVWGAIRSTGTEGVFITAAGGRGNMWFRGASDFEFCYGNLNEEMLSAYCGVLNKVSVSKTSD